jgi:anionic cell wall polymer biosynthesis LytR-Cps2A-Psr (LCP) family protein
MKDDTTGFTVDAPGCRVLDGSQALAFARSRRAFHVLGPDGWELDPTSDLGRMARQRVLASAAAHALVDLEPTPGDLQTLVGVFTDHAVVDDALTNDDLLSWGRWLVSRGDDNLTEYALPVESGTVGTASVLFLGDGWEQVIAEFEAGQPQTAPATVTGPGGPEVPAPVVPALCN